MRKQQQFPEDEEIGNMENKRKLSEENVEMEKMIDMQKTEIRKLRVQIKDMETVINSRPPSGSRLPPVAVGQDFGVKALLLKIVLHCPVIQLFIFRVWMMRVLFLPCKQTRSQCIREGKNEKPELSLNSLFFLIVTVHCYPKNM